LNDKTKSEKIYEKWTKNKEPSLDFIKEIKGLTHEEDIELYRMVLYMQNLGITYLSMINKFKDDINFIKDSEI